jgi:RNA polymerase sigma-70 factor, ECF subfamily
MDSSKEVSRLLARCSSGDNSAFNELLPLIHNELHRLAAGYMSRERPDHTLQTTALVNEAYLRLVDQPNAQWQDRAHFFAVASKVMRQILIDHARSRGRVKRGGGAMRIELDDVAEMSEERAEDLLALDAALTKLAERDHRKSEVVELRFFGGLTIEEAAEVLKVTTKTQGEQNPRTLEARECLVKLYEDWGKAAEAARYRQ